MNVLMLVLALIATAAVFATTTRGREIAKSLGFRDSVPGAAPSDDVAYLRNACGGDRAQADRLVEVERERFPDLSEAEHYRRAIRKVMAARDS